MILMDLDGTLLRNDKTVSSYSLSVLERCKASGILIGIATARGMLNTSQYISQIQPDIAIMNDGALAMHGNAELFSLRFSQQQTKQIIYMAQELTDHQCEITVDTQSGYYWNYKTDQQKADNNWRVGIYTDYSDFNEEALKICVELPNYALAQQIAEAVDDCDCVRFSDGNWYKFGSHAATKENAAKTVSTVLGIDLNDIIAFGDDFPDIGMLRICGKGIAMKNAIPEVKSIADEVTESNENDGVAIYLERFLDI